MGLLTPGELARAYLASFADGDPASFVAEDFVNEHASALGTPSTGRTAYASRLPAFRASLPGLRYDVESVLVDGDEVAAFYVLRADGGIEVRGCMHLWVTGHVIARRLDIWDSLTYQRQAAGA